MLRWRRLHNRVAIARRLLLIIPTVLLVTVIVFVGMRLIPGDLVDYLTTQVRIFGGREEAVEMTRRNLGSTCRCCAAPAASPAAASLAARP